jgi:hypothetical protein
MAAIAALILVLVGCASEDDSKTPEPAVVESAATSLEPEALEAEDPAQRERIEFMTQDAAQSVMRAAQFLGDQTRFRVTAEISYDVVQNDGRLLEFGARREITINRPNHVHMKITRRDGETRALYFDGSTISIDLAEHQAYVRESRPGTLYAALEHLANDLGIPVPLANLLSENFAAPLERRIAAGYYVGPAILDGRRCEHLAFRLPDVDVQLWIEEGERPLAARIVITHKLAPGNPQFRATLKDWDLGLETPEALFQFEPPEGSEKLAVESIFAAAGAAGENPE